MRSNVSSHHKSLQYKEKPEITPNLAVNSRSQYSIATKKPLFADRRLGGWSIDLSICDKPPAGLYASALTA